MSGKNITVKIKSGVDIGCFLLFMALISFLYSQQLMVPQDSVLWVLVWLGLRCWTHHHYGKQLVPRASYAGHS